MTTQSIGNRDWVSENLAPVWLQDLLTMSYSHKILRLDASLSVSSLLNST